MFVELTFVTTAAKSIIMSTERVAEMMSPQIIGPLVRGRKVPAVISGERLTSYIVRSTSNVLSGFYYLL